MAFPLTRRELVLTAAAASAATPQTQQVPLPAKADEELQAAREQRRQAANRLGQTAVPMSTEPAVHFKP